MAIWRTVLAGIAATLAIPARADGLPDWDIDALCAREAAAGQCIVLEAQARRTLSGGWPVLPVEYRSTCLKTVTAPHVSYRLLSQCIEVEVDKAARARRNDAFERLAAADAERNAAARRKAEEDARQAAEAEARRKAEEDARRAAEAEARRKAEDHSAGTSASTIAKVEEAAPQSPEAARCENALRGTAAVGSINFAFNSAALDGSSTTTLDQLAAAARGCSNVTIRIDGHTDDLGTGSFNMSLSEQRAQAVAAYLTKAGITAQQLQARGFGESRPIAPNTTPSSRARNRRIEFTVR
ncbi:MAG: OmpA family protein [Hyphomicrobiaceae bacterium]|nr:OmpA family protein [Hyphomicrobiaceae bacterium]